eukprot:scaffold280629_cov36-Tisochrysis_lutea.AAC.7
MIPIPTNAEGPRIAPLARLRWSGALSHHASLPCRLWGGVEDGNAAAARGRHSCTLAASLPLDCSGTPMRSE